MGGMNYIVKPLQTLALASAFVVAAATYVQDAKALEGPSTSYNTIQVINYSPGQEVNGSHDSVSDDGLAFPGGTGEAGIEPGSNSYNQQEDAPMTVGDICLAKHVYGNDIAEVVSQEDAYTNQLEQLSQTYALVVGDTSQTQCSAILDSMVANVKGDEQEKIPLALRYIYGTIASLVVLGILWAVGDAAYTSVKEQKKEQKSSRREEDEEPSEPTSSTTLDLASEYSRALQSSTPDVVEPESDPGYNGTSGRDRRARGVWARFATPTSEQQYATTADPEVAAKRRQARKKKARQRKAKKGY